MSSVELPSIQTNFAPYSTSSSSSSTAISRPYRSASPSSPPPAMTFQSRSYSTSSASSLLSTYSSSSDRSLSVSPGPATPCDMMSRSPSFSHDSIYKPSLPSLQHKQLPHYSSYPPSSSHPSSPSLPSTQRYNSSSTSSSVRHHPYQTVQHHQKQYYQSNYQERSFTSQHPSTYRPLLSPSSPHDMFSTHSSSRGHGDYHPSYHHQHQQHHQKTEQQQQPHQQRSPYSSNSHQVEYFHSRSPTTKTSSSFNSAFAYHSAYPMMTPKEEERESSYTRAMTPHQHHQTRAASSPLLKEEEDDEEEDDDRSEYAPSMSHSPSMSHAGSSFSRESSPLMTSDRLGSMSEASDSMTSLVSSSSSTGSMTPVPTTTQLLLCPVCSRAFKPSKNQNCNLRRHLKNVHNMSPTMHPRKCKWDSLPDGRVKDDKDRKERTRKSKRLWARKFRLRRKVEEAAVVLSMLSQAV